jgi:hypothetical protein
MNSANRFRTYPAFMLSMTWLRLLQPTLVFFASLAKSGKSGWIIASHAHHFINWRLKLMEASVLVYKTLTSPVAAVLPLVPPDELELLPGSLESELQNSTAWARSALNPRNRVDTLPSATTHLPQPIQWHMSGCFVTGSQFYAHPRFALGRPPLFIDVYIPDQGQHPPALRLLLQSGATMTCP